MKFYLTSKQIERLHYELAGRDVEVRITVLDPTNEHETLNNLAPIKASVNWISGFREITIPCNGGSCIGEGL